MSRYEQLLEKLLKGETADIVPRSRMERALLNCIDKCGCDGLPTPTSNAEVYLHAIADKAQNSAPIGTLGSVATAAEMDEILATATEADVGKAYIYTGETTDKYESGALYRIATE